MRGKAPKRSAKYGICALTGKRGKFAKSHIIPKALTKPSVSGAPLMESTHGQCFARRWTSWIDRNLVIAEGEKVLAEIDDAGIKELRRLKLNWSSWGTTKPEFLPLGSSIPDHSIRTVELEDASILRRFILSIVWRSAASKLTAMAAVKATSANMERLRQIVLGNTPIHRHDFPTCVIQISTVGEIHNQTPYNDLKPQPGALGTPSLAYEIARVYFDGVIFHVHWSDADLDLNENSLFLGCSNVLHISAVTYERSFQREKLLANAH